MGAASFHTHPTLLGSRFEVEGGDYIEDPTRLSFYPGLGESL